MSNCPGRKSIGGPSTGSNASVTVSSVSRRFDATRKARGVMGPATSVDTGIPIEIQEPHPRRMHPSPQDLGDPLHQLEAERVVLLTFRPQAFGVDLHGPHFLHGARVELPSIRREQPRSTDDLA